MAKERSARTGRRSVPANRTKAEAQAGQIAHGALLTHHSPETVEMLGTLDFDFVTLDPEHESYNELALVHSVQAADAFGMTPIVRLANDPDLILRLLDAGVQGIHIPRVNTKEDPSRRSKRPSSHPRA